MTFNHGFSQNVYVLIGLRLLQGAITGYGTACTTLIATQTDKEHAGYALGTLSTSSIAGSLQCRLSMEFRYKRLLCKKKVVLIIAVYNKILYNIY